MKPETTMKIYQQLLEQVNNHLDQIDYPKATLESPVTISDIEQHHERTFQTALGNVATEFKVELGTPVFRAINATRVYLKSPELSLKQYEAYALPNSEEAQAFKDQHLSVLKQALRIELFREFHLDMNIKPRPTDLTEHDIAESYKISFQQHFNDLQKTFRSQMTPSGCNHIVTDINKLINEFEQIVKEHQVVLEYLCDQPDISKEQRRLDYEEMIYHFQINSGIFLDSYQFKAESEHSWKPFITHALMLLSLWYTASATLSIAHRMLHGHYAQEDPITLKKLDESDVWNKPKYDLIRRFFDNNHLGKVNESDINIFEYLNKEPAEGRIQYD